MTSTLPTNTILNIISQWLKLQTYAVCSINVHTSIKEHSDKSLILLCLGYLWQMASTRGFLQTFSPSYVWIISINSLHFNPNTPYVPMYYWLIDLATFLLALFFNHSIACVLEMSLIEYKPRAYSVIIPLLLTGTANLDGSCYWFPTHWLFALTSVLTMRKYPMSRTGIKRIMSR